MPPRRSDPRPRQPPEPIAAGANDLAAIGPVLLAWYDRHRRVLPWRPLPGERPDPYAVWLSEVMLQQTTTTAVKPYYARFLALWPTVADLAAAPSEDVMREWAGLGYYARARNLHACAKAVLSHHGGRFPDTESALRDLPGIGAYTAAAVAAFAFGRHAVVVDGNVERLMARLAAVADPLPQARPKLRDAMASATPAERAGDFAQGAMDLAATICTPKNPACTICPLRAHCAASRLGVQNGLPVKAARRPAPVRHGVVFLIRDDAGAILVRTRPPTGLLGGTVELPGTAWMPVEDGHVPAARPAPGAVPVGRVTHVFTHFTLLLDVVVVPDPSTVLGVEEIAACRPVQTGTLDREGFSTLMRNALALGLKAEPAESSADQRANVKVGALFN